MLNTLFKGFSVIVVIRILSRVIDFFLKIFVIRAIDPQIFAATVPLQLITNVALFYTKTCLKNSYQKRVDSATHHELMVSATNVMLLGVPVSIVLGSAMVVGYQFFNYSTLAYFSTCVSIVGIGAVFEALQQCFITRLVLEFKYDKIGQIEIISLLSKSIVLWIAVYLRLFHKYGVLVFGVSQIVYSIMLVLIGFYMTNPTRYMLQKIEVNNQLKYVHPQMLKAVKEFSVMSLIKFGLQELQKIILVGYNEAKMSADYTMISNLGSVIPRYLFMPLEQIAFNTFSKNKEIQENKQTISILVRILVIFGTVLTVFGFCYSENLLKLLFGDQWSHLQTIYALRVYCLYVLVMGINGISQSFVYARINAEQLKSFRIYMFVTTCIYLAVSILFINLHLGAAGLFLGSCISMLFRIFICWKTYILPEIFKQYTGLHQIAFKLMPKTIVLISLTISLFLCFETKDYFSNPLFNLVVGAGICGINVLIIALSEKEIVTGFNKLKSN